MKSWLLWYVRCLRGWRCPHVVIHDFDAPPEGITVGLSYNCPTCGSYYVWNSREGRKRVRRPLEPPAESVPVGDLEPGEEKTVLLRKPDG
jgi:hypothetical protein